MAADLSTITSTPRAGWAARRITLGNAGVATQVTLPLWTRKVTVTFRQSDASNDTGKVAESGTDGQNLGNDHFPVGSGYALTWSLLSGDGIYPSQNPVIYVTGGTNTGHAHLVIEP